jgi:Type IV secretion-system coupling protein DNA-binding domain.
MNSLPITSTLKIPQNIETTHFFICGQPGMGKSHLLYWVIQKVLERNDKAIFNVGKYLDSKINPKFQKQITIALVREDTLFSKLRLLMITIGRGNEMYADVGSGNGLYRRADIILVAGFSQGVKMQAGAGIGFENPSGDYSGSTRYLHELFLYKFNEAQKKRSGRTALSKIR